MDAEWKFFRRRGSRGFTLVEMITVIGVIGILAALLLAALSQAKAVGQSTACKNHLRQIGVSMETFLSDNDSYPTMFAYDEGFDKRWEDQLNRYDPLSWTNISWHCPTYIGRNGFVGRPPGQPNGWLYTSYSYNGYGIGGLRFQELGLGAIPSGTPREQQVVAPGEMYAVADARAGWVPSAAGIGGTQWMDPYHFFGGQIRGAGGVIHELGPVNTN